MAKNGPDTMEDEKETPAPTLQERYQALYEQMAQNASVAKFGDSAPKLPIPSIDEILQSYQPLETVREGMSWSAREARPEEKEAHKNSFIDTQIKPLLDQHERGFGQKLAALQAQFSHHGHPKDKYGKPRFAPLPSADESQMEGVETGPQTGWLASRGQKGTMNQQVGLAFQHHQLSYQKAQAREFSRRHGTAMTESDDYVERNSNPMRNKGQ